MKSEDLRLCCCGPRQQELDRDPMSGQISQGHHASFEEDEEVHDEDEVDEESFTQISRAFAIRARNQENVPTNSSEGISYETETF